MNPALDEAVRALRAGELVVYPTDTLLGLAARATDAHAVARLERLKQRPADQPISIAVRSIPDVEVWTDLAPTARRFVRTHLPGPYTLVARASRLARQELVPALLAPDGTVGVRLPDHPVARELARRVGPITATSANLHGQPPCRTIAEARQCFGSNVRVYVGAGPRGSGRPSTLVDLTGAEPHVLARR